MNGELPADEGGLQKLDRQDVMTGPGRWLRRSSLDELPQLINVLRGEMSLVGPRPCIRYEAAHFAPHQFERFSMPAGITGLWQVTARGHATFAEALEMDVVYVRDWSLRLDGRSWHAPWWRSAEQRATVDGDRGHRRERHGRAAVNVGVVGLGYWGPNLVRNFQDLEVAEITWMCDRRPPLLKALGSGATRRCRRPSTSTRCWPTTRWRRSRSPPRSPPTTTLPCGCSPPASTSSSRSRWRTHPSRPRP